MIRIIEIYKTTYNCLKQYKLNVFNYSSLLDLVFVFFVLYLCTVESVEKMDRGQLFFMYTLVCN